MMSQGMSKVAVFISAVLMAVVFGVSTVSANTVDMITITFLVAMILVPLMLTRVPNSCSKPWLPWLLLLLLQGTQSFIFPDACEDDEEVESKGTLYVVLIILVLMFAICGCCDFNQHDRSYGQPTLYC